MEVEMESSEISNSVAKSETNFPYKIFISHKVSEHGGAVKKLKKILNQNKTLKEKIVPAPERLDSSSKR